MSIPYTQADEYVFLNKWGAKHQNLSHIFTTLKKKLKIREEVKLHSFRHTFATLLIRQGQNLSLISKHLGHSDINITNKNYAHLVIDDLMDLSNDFGKRINQLIQNNGKESYR